MRKVFAVLATALLVVIGVQFFLAAVGAFDTAPNEESFQPHRVLGYGFILLALASTVAAALARVPGRVVGMAALAAGLGVGQSLIRAVAAALDDPGGGTSAGPLVFGLHALNALLIMGVAENVARQARTLARAGRPAQPVP